MLVWVLKQAFTKIQVKYKQSEKNFNQWWLYKHFTGPEIINWVNNTHILLLIEVSVPIYVNTKSKQFLYIKVCTQDHHIYSTTHSGKVKNLFSNKIWLWSSIEVSRKLIMNKNLKLTENWPSDLWPASLTKFIIRPVYARRNEARFPVKYLINSRPVL